MKIKMKQIFTFLTLFLIIFSISIQNNMKNTIETTQEDLQDRTINLKQAGFWNNFTFIHITNLNWTVANNTEWCSGSGTWGDPYVIENMIINASGSPIGCGIFIENSANVYFTIRNVTIFETTNGIKLENTNQGTLVNNVLSNNIENGIYMNNCVNNTISRNQIINNGMQGIYFFSYCLNNKILENTIKNDGTNLQNTGIYLEDFCDNNEILENFIFDNNDNGIVFYDDCRRNMLYNNTIKNTVTSQQDYGVRLESNSDHNIISHNVIEDLSNWGIRLVTSDNTSISNNRIINCNYGIYLLLTFQSKIINNTISDVSTAILMSAGDAGKFVGNFINNTGNYAIQIILNSNDNEFYDNIIKENSNYGIYIEDPSDSNNIFYKNSFISSRIHAIDNGTANFWNNTVIGNYWDNYSGVDSNYDNIGDTPYNISGLGNANDSLPIVDHGPPSITINTPVSSEFGATAPEFNIFVNETYIYSMWYTVNNNGIKYYFTENGTIDQDAWNALNDGIVIITFYARDIAWNTGSDTVVVNKNTLSPSVTITSPTVGEYFDKTAPNFVVEISDSDSTIDTMWYTLNGGANIEFTANGTIDLGNWTVLADGAVALIFYANDSAGNVGSDIKLINKDTSVPTFKILSPFLGQTFGALAPNFTVEIDDATLHTMWYNLNGGVNITFVSNGTIDAGIWTALPSGQVTLTFFANDTFGLMNSASVNLIKSAAQVPSDGPPSLDAINIIVISIIVISVIVIAGIVMRRLSIKNKKIISPKLNEEQSSKAQYVKDISSILTILAIHNESGLCLSKIAVHGGIGLDEHLFTGFISAMGSFKNELAKQMGLRVRGEGGDNTIEYNEFTITLLDGEYLRLGLVSYSSLGDLIKKQCGQVLSTYEIKHVDDLKNFDGDIQVFNDFEEAIETGLDMNLNRKSIINVKQLNNFDAPEPFITILNDLKSKSDGFYPAEINFKLVQDMSISEEEANFMVYDAYKNQIFLPKKLGK